MADRGGSRMSDADASPGCATARARPASNAIRAACPARCPRPTTRWRWSARRRTTRAGMPRRGQRHLAAVRCAGRLCAQHPRACDQLVAGESGGSRRDGAGGHDAGGAARRARRPRSLARHRSARPPRRTIGSVVATGTAGPLRQGFGPVRDHVLGCTVVTGDGRVVERADGS